MKESTQTSVLDLLPALHSMTKPAGPICNLNRQCCFYLMAEILYPSKARRPDSAMQDAASRLRKLYGLMILVLYSLVATPVILRQPALARTPPMVGTVGTASV
jgi:hypothetical protein